MLSSISAALLLFAAVPVQGDACCEDKAASIEQRVREIDVAVALRTYEQIQTEMTKAQLQWRLMETDFELDDAERAKQVQGLRRRLENLSAFAQEIRMKLQEMSKPVAVAAK